MLRAARHASNGQSSTRPGTLQRSRGRPGTRSFRSGTNPFGALAQVARAGRGLVLGKHTGGDEPDAVGDVDRVVAEALVEAGDDRELDGHLEIDRAAGVALEDLRDELAVDVVEQTVHVGERRR